MQQELDTATPFETMAPTTKGSDSIARVCSLAYQTCSAIGESTDDNTNDLLSKIVSRTNMQLAYKRVVQNKGAPGVDGVTVDELANHCKQHWPRIRASLLQGTYRPQAVRVVSIPKASGGERQLGIPTVIDRLIQQAINQILQPLFDPRFSDSSYGFRPSRNAQQAVDQARNYIREGHRWVVDLDLANFFDTVNHDVLMYRLWKRIDDRVLLKLIRRYLQAGLFTGGIVGQRAEGMPQGGPLSPLLSNILLDDLDKELERRGHCFVRYADDCNIYVKSQAAGARVMRSIEGFIVGRLKLRLNRDKSAVARPWHRSFLGYSFTHHYETKLKVAPTSIKRLKGKLKDVFRCGRGRRVQTTIAELNRTLIGWLHYFKYSEVRGVFEELDGWLRRKLRCIYWRQWKKPKTRERKLKQLGIDAKRAWKSAMNGRGPWWNAGASHMNQAIPTRRLRLLGLISLMETYQRVKYC